LFFTHGATTITLVRELLGDETLPIRVGCCSLSVMGRKKNAKKVVGGWDALVVGGDKYLRDGTSREWGFQDIEVANGEVSPHKVVQFIAVLTCGRH
jgi:transcription factor C subunit 7